MSCESVHRSFHLKKQSIRALTPVQMHKFWTTIFSTVTLISFLGKNVVRGSENVWDISSLDRFDDETFRKLVIPLSHMSLNAYSWPFWIARSVNGWTLVDAVYPANGGMHALLYREDSNSGKMVIAFKGTGGAGSSQLCAADICIDEILWGPIRTIFDPQDCSVFSDETLDYHQQAVDYTSEVLKRYPHASILLTGHSLGAGLTVLTTASFAGKLVLPVIAFSAPGPQKALEMLALKLTAAHRKQVYIVADKWDPIVRFTWANQVGTLCLYETPISMECLRCYRDSETSSVSAKSSLAFADHLRYKKIETQQQQDASLGKQSVGLLINNDCVKCCSRHDINYVEELIESRPNACSYAIEPLSVAMN